jgi:type I restriction enzyme S subunit
MSFDWNQTTLGAICARQNGSIQTGPFGSQLHTSDYKEFGTPVVMPTNIADSGIDETGIARISQKDVDRLSQHILKRGDIVFSRRGDVTKNALISDREVGWFCGTGCLKVRLGDESIAAADFISQYLRLPSIKEWLIRHAVGATMPNLNTGILSAVPVTLPSLSEQKQIAKILDDFDRKIELNRQTNQTLEQIAQAIFKSWFVDFEPTRAKIAAKDAGASSDAIERAAMCVISGKSLDELEQLSPATQQQLRTTAALFPDALVESELGEIPAGWEISAMGKYVEIKRGGSPRPIQDFMADSGFPWTKISDATAESSPFLFGTKEFIKEEGLKKTVLLKKGTLILSNSATPGLPKFLELDACIHDGWLYFPSKKHFSDIYLFHLFLVLKASFISQGNGSIFTNLKTDILRNQIIVIPPNALIRHFDITANHIFGVVRGNCKETNALITLRDTLLPKLLSGNIQIKTNKENKNVEMV